MLVQRLDDARPHIRDRRYVEDDLAGGQLLEECRILHSANPVPDPVRLEGVDRSPDGDRTDDLAGVGNRAESLFARACERLDEFLGRVQRLLSTEPDPDNAAVAVLRRVSRPARRRPLERRRA